MQEYIMYNNEISNTNKGTTINNNNINNNNNNSSSGGNNNNKRTTQNINSYNTSSSNSSGGDGSGSFHDATFGGSGVGSGSSGGIGNKGNVFMETSPTASGLNRIAEQLEQVFGSGSRGMCKQHSDQELVSYCDDCKVMVCLRCMTSKDHRKHDFIEPQEMEDNVRDVSKDLYQRMSVMFEQLRKYTRTIKSYKETKQRIKDFFDDFHRTLMNEEHKYHKAIDQETDRLMARINDHKPELELMIDAHEMSQVSSGLSSMQTVSDIQPEVVIQPDDYKSVFMEHARKSAPQPSTHVVQPVEMHPTANSIGAIPYRTGSSIAHEVNPHVTVKMDIEEFRIALQNSESLEQYVQTYRNPSVIYQSFEPIHVDRTFTHIQQRFAKREPVDPVKFDFVVSDEHMGRAISMIRQACELVINDLTTNSTYMTKYITDNTISSIYTLCGMENTQHLNTVETYDVANNRWGLADSTRMKRACSSASVVSTGDYLYIFGGNDTLSTYERMNLTTGKWDSLDTIETTGGSSLAATYDEGRYIYLIGGIQSNNTLDRVDRFDVMTGRCVNVGKLKSARYYCFACYKDGYIYIIGGTRKEKDQPYQPVNDIEAFSVADGTSKPIFSFPSKSRVEGFCFDKREFIYFLTNSVFCRFSILTRRLEALYEAPIREGRFGLSLVFGYVGDEPKIYLIGGKEARHWVYDINTNTWKDIMRKSKTTYFHGAVGINLSKLKTDSNALAMPQQTTPTLPNNNNNYYHTSANTQQLNPKK